MSEIDSAKYVKGYIRAWAVIVLTAAFVIGVGLIALGSLHTFPPAVGEGLNAVGSSVIASLILYVLVSILLDPKKQMAQAEQAILFGIQVANRQFTERFAVALPTEVFEGSSIPKLSFRNAFVTALSESTRYDFKGDSANFTTYRLAKCVGHREISRLDQIRLCVLDPTSERAVAAYAEQYLRQDSATLDAGMAAVKAKEIREDVYVSLWTLYIIRHHITTSVYFHSDLPFFRCELFDGTMFLTYYLDRRIYPDYPETLQFGASTRPYRAYSTAIAVARHFAPSMLVFGETGPGPGLINTDEKFATTIKLLGCDMPVSELEELRVRRFAKFDEWLADAKISTVGLF